MPCIKCEVYLSNEVFQYSLNEFGEPFCRNCQNWFREILGFSSASEESINLFFALRKRGIPAELEKSDGFKTIDIAIPKAKLNIEVDGIHHNKNSRQALSDLKRTFYSLEKGFYTLRIPNSLVRENLDEATDLIVNIAELYLGKKKSYF